MKNELIQAFDVLAYLQDRGISHSLSGENVSSGWVGVNCPFCEDQLNHLGINLSSKLFSCWKCGAKGSIVKYIQRVENCSWAESYKILRKYIDRFYSFTTQPQEIKSSEIYSYIKKFKTELPDPHRNYLIKRGFDPDYIANKYNLLASPMTGDFRYRLIAPIYMNFELVSFVGRDVTGQGDPRYKNCPDSISTIPVKSCLYNIDSARKDSVIVVEGITDVWRMGDDTVGLFGVQYTVHQLRLLTKFNRIFVMLDSEAMDVANKLASDLSSVVKEVEVLQLAEGDPAELSAVEVAKLKYELNLR